MEIHLITKKHTMFTRTVIGRTCLTYF